MAPIEPAFNVIKGLKKVSVSAELTEADYYYSEGMLGNNVLFEVYTLETDLEESDFAVLETYITVCVCDLPETFFRASEYTMYTGLILTNIQIHRIIKDLFELYLSYPLTGANSFIEILENMCVSHRSSLAQKSGVHKKLTYYEIKKKITRIVQYELNAGKQSEKHENI